MFEKYFIENFYDVTPEQCFKNNMEKAFEAGRKAEREELMRFFEYETGVTISALEYHYEKWKKKEAM